MFNSGKRTPVAVRAILLAFVAAGIAGGIYFLATEAPTPSSYYPKCVFYQTTHLHCPGCGTGRSLHFLLNGDFETAARFNIFSMVILPFLAVRGLVFVLRWALGYPPQRAYFIPAKVIWLLFAVIMAFWIARNLPWYPFTLLAPHELN